MESLGGDTTRYFDTAERSDESEAPLSGEIRLAYRRVGLARKAGPCMRKLLTVSLRNPAGDVILKRQVSTEPKRCLEFFVKLHEHQASPGYIAIVEFCDFNDWLSGEYGSVLAILIQPIKKPKVKTNRRDAHALSELL